MQNIDNIIERLKMAAEWNIDAGVDPDSSSYHLEEGVLITANEALEIVEMLGALQMVYSLLLKREK